MTVEDQTWVQEQITAAVQRHDEALRPLVIINKELIKQVQRQQSGVCANLTNHEERLVMLERWMEDL